MRVFEQTPVAAPAPLAYLLLNARAFLRQLQVALGEAKAVLVFVNMHATVW
jgi:hypothetical protein